MRMWPLLLLAACAQGPARPQPQIGGPYFKILQQMKDAYAREDLNEFMKHVSPRYYKDSSALREAVITDFRESNVQSLDIWHEKTVDTFVEVRWEKRYEDRRTGRRVTGRGRTEFAFDKDGIVDQKGDVLFGWNESRTVPDLTVESVTVAIPAISAEIANLGQTDVQNVRVRLMIDGVAVGTDQFVVVPGRGKVTASWSGGFIPPAPGHTARVLVDPVNSIVELNELNNERDRPY